MTTGSPAHERPVLAVGGGPVVVDGPAVVDRPVVADVPAVVDRPVVVISGLAVVDKPAGMTSHDVVARCRRIFGQKKVGHAGTLDPDATGVLLIGLGQATRLLQFQSGLSKSYTAEIVLGVSTTTLDAAGEVTGRWDQRQVSLDDARRAASQLTGTVWQTPPMVSAVKVGGRRLHELARQGLEVERVPRRVDVASFDVESLRPAGGSGAEGAGSGDAGEAGPAGAGRAGARPEEAGPGGPGPALPALAPADEAAPPEAGGAGSGEAGVGASGIETTGPVLAVRVECSAGTYVRVLAADLGAALGGGAHVRRLRRTAVGPWSEAMATPLDTLSEADVLPPVASLPWLDPVAVDAERAREVQHGRVLERDGFGGEGEGPWRVIGPDGDLLAVYQSRGAGEVKPAVVLAQPDTAS